MTTARSLLVDSESPGFYHCISRCVRRAWLCGIDPYDGKSYEHRRDWVEGRLLELADIFAVGIYAYAVMSNHVHVVLRIDPEATSAWTPDDVATRWVRLFPATADGEIDPIACRTRQIPGHPQFWQEPTSPIRDFLQTQLVSVVMLFT